MSSAGCAALSLASWSRKPTSSMTLAASSGGIDGPPVGRDDRRVGPAAEVGADRLGHTEELADHEHRQRRGQHVDQIDDLAARDRVEQADGERPDLVLHAAQRPAGELPVEDAAPLVVSRRIHVQDRARRRCRPRGTGR